MVRPQQSNPRPPALQTELILSRLAITSNKLQNKNSVFSRGNRNPRWQLKEMYEGKV